MSKAGYYRNPTVWENKLVFVADDDLWMVSLEGGKAERLTSGVGEANDPAFSPDGQWIAFTGTYEGHSEVYVKAVEGGAANRLTYISEGSIVVGWKNATEIIFSSTKNHPFRLRSLYTVNLTSEKVERLPCGPSNVISYNPEGKGSVIQRHGHGYVSWKRYKGGTAGDLWIDRKGKGEFKKLISVKGNALKPLWVQNRIYFITDHQGHGNVYSCSPEGDDLKRHTSHEDFFVRGLSYNGDDSFIYAAGGDLFHFSIETNSSEKLDIDFPSSFSQRARKFVDSSACLSGFSLNQTGSHLAITTRGRPFSFANWEGAVHQYGEKDGIRYKFINWLHDNKRVLIVSDREGEDRLEIHEPHALKDPIILKKMDLGRIVSITPSPTKDEAVLINHRCELFHVNLKSQKIHLIDKSTFADMNSLNWSPDGKWIVYDYPITDRTRAIKLCEIKGFKTHVITHPILEDFQPSFDPDGKYIYFLSNRTYTPYRDNLQFEMGFPKGTKPYLILLDETLTSPFIPQLKEIEDKEKSKKDAKKEGKEEGPKEVKIDLVGIENRILEFPVLEGNYSKIKGIHGKVLYLSRPLQSALGEEDDVSPKSSLECYDFGTQKEETLISKISSFTLSADSQWLCYYGAEKLRVLKAGEKPQDNDTSYRKGGWIDLNRVKVSINPLKEWIQIFDEVWRLQRDFFWTEDMSKVDWKGIYNRYRPLVERICTRGELTDLIAEMHGELGTSHTYVFGGDFRQTPAYPLGELGADFTYDKTHKGFKITNIAYGDRWSPSQTSPLTAPGLGIEEGDILLAINGQKLEENVIPEKLLVNQAHNTVSLLVKKGKKKEKDVSVRTLMSQTPARYRDWVEKNRAYVHEKTKGQVGYIHIPDMGAKGFAEFHRGFLAELNKEGLIVDVRFNGGGNVSGLLLEKLSRKRLGYDQSRWWSAIPYPFESPMGPMVALTNEYAGSDGDIFSHSFKMLKLGPLIGKRTWGGVIGMWFRHGLVDGGGTSQPEFSFWFHDVGWGVENYGVDPDIEVEITPQDYEKGIDPQLDRGIAEVLAILKTAPTPKPFLTERPNLAPPKLEVI